MIGVGLTDEEKQEAISKACGKHHYLGVLWPGSRCTACGEYINDPVHDWPDYLGSLDAIHEAEKTLTPEQQAAYLDWFWHNLPEEENHGPNLDGEGDIMIVGIWQVLTATARQRADAFLASLPVQQPQPEKI